MNIDNEDKEFSKVLQEKLGMSEAEAQKAMGNLHFLALHITMLDTGLSTLDTNIVRQLNEKAVELNAKGLKLMSLDKIEKLTAICDLAEQYQSQFPNKEPKINAFPPKAVMA